MKAKTLNARKQKILGAIVNDYLHDAEPVSSENIRERHMRDISPATIRNEMAELEKEGFLDSSRTPLPAGSRRTWATDILLTSS